MAGSLADLADLVGGRLIGDGSTRIEDAEVIAAAGRADITLADGPEHAEALSRSTAAAAVVSDDAELGDKPGIVVDDVHDAFGKIVAQLRPSLSLPARGVSPEACVNPSADFAEDVVVYSGASIGAGVRIGPGATIHAGARIAAGCVIGEGVTVFPNAVLYENTQVGDRSIIHAGVVIGGYGFGYRSDDRGHELSQQLGYVRIGRDVEIGANATIDRGTYGATSIGDGTKIDNLVQIGHNCRIGRHNLICSQVGIAGSTSTGDFVVMAGQVGVRDHVHIGDRAVLSAMAGVPNDVAAGEVMLGAPATPIRDQKLQMAAVAKLPEMRKQFRRMQRQWDALQQQLAGEGGSEDKAA
ncbi:MAG: UDP-3-O-(3-hydroxymyristoyl)glucosamine N-acyltransferase [Planctomycetota bacterium]